MFNDNGNTVSLEIKTYGYDGKPNLKIKDLNDLLRVTVYYEENRILREQSELEDRKVMITWRCRKRYILSFL